MKENKVDVILNRLPAPERRIFWFIIILIVKFSLLIFLVNQGRPTSIENSFAACSGDCDSYLTPIDNLIEYGSYVPDYRMPGYGIVYFLFRMLFEKNIAANLVVIFQTMIDALAVLVLALTTQLITGRKTAFYATIFLYGIGVTVSCYDNFILTESPTSSILIFGFYFFVKHFITGRRNFILLSGLFFTWAYFLRPVNMPLLLIPAALILFSGKGSRLKNLAFFFLPVIVAQSAWTIRNYQLKNKVFLLTEHTYMSIYTPANLHVWDFCKTFSDFRFTTTFFDTSGTTYFGQSFKMIRQEDIHIPDDIYTKDFNYDSLLLLRDYLTEFKAKSTSAERKEQLSGTIINKFMLYEESVRKYHPVIVYVRTPLILVKSFLTQSGVHNLFFYPFSYLSVPQKIFKLFFIFIYMTAFILFLFGSIFYIRQIINNKMILMSYAIAFYIIFIHSIVLRSIELRYIIPAYPFFVCGAVFCIVMLTKRFSTKTV